MSPVYSGGVAQVAQRMGKVLRDLLHQIQLGHIYR